MKSLSITEIIDQLGEKAQGTIIKMVANHPHYCGFYTFDPGTMWKIDGMSYYSVGLNFIDENGVEHEYINTEPNYKGGQSDFESSKMKASMPFDKPWVSRIWQIVE